MKRPISWTISSKAQDISAEEMACGRGSEKTVPMD